MAAPPEVTLKNLSGKWMMNKNLCGDSDAILALQGVGWLARKTIGLANITLTIKQYVNDQGVTRIDIDQVLSGGIKGTTETRVLDWTERPHEDHVFGKVKGKSRFMKLADVQDPFLKTGWLPEMSEGDVFDGYVESVDNGWVAEQIWGFEEIKGARRYVRHVVVTKGKVRKEAKLVYDYIGKA